MILENLEVEEREEAQAELEGLAARLRHEGFEVRVAPIDGPFHAILQESAEQAAIDVLNVVLEKVEAHAIDAAVGAATAALLDWGRRRRCFRNKDQAQAMAVIWGPDGEPIRHVSLPAPEDSLDVN
jgi:hypothetical protein